VKQTLAKAASWLERSGYEVTQGVGGTGVVGMLRNGDGPTVMLRGDMDALPIKEQTGLPYASEVTAKDSEGTTVPVMHACGHDVHTPFNHSPFFAPDRGPTLRACLEAMTVGALAFLD
jgi:metal-dependent amidase/aminoacylase/carboxypeptidase family protein